MASVSDEQEEKSSEEMIVTDEGISIRRIDPRDEILFL
jgi:hypothetical protein